MMATTTMSSTSVKPRLERIPLRIRSRTFDMSTVLLLA